MSRFDARRFLDAVDAELRVECRDAVESTNDCAWQRLTDDERPLVVVAERQRHGRGRRGHRWWSPERGGLYLSVALSAPARPELAPTRWTIAAGLAACEACRQAGAAATIEWPNDVMVGARKLGGVLVEVRTGQGRLQLVIGAGVNLELGEAPPEIAARAIDLAEARGSLPPPREALAAELVEGLLTAHRALLRGEHAALWRAWESMAPRALGCPVRVERDDAPPLAGTTRGLDAVGALRVETEQGECRSVHLVDAVSYQE